MSIRKFYYKKELQEEKRIPGKKNNKYVNKDKKNK